MEVCCYRVCVEETRKELSYLSAIGVVTTEGNFNTMILSCISVCELEILRWLPFTLCEDEGGG